MAIKPCKECGAPVSDKAETCPMCGVKQKKKTSKLALIFAGLVLVFIFVELFKSDPADTNTSVAAKKEENKAGVMLFYIQNQIKQNAKDPDSVQFRNEKINNNLKRTKWQEQNISLKKNVIL